MSRVAMVTIRNRKQQGIALVLCLLFMMMFSGIAIYISEKMKQEIRIVQAFEDKLQSQLQVTSELNDVIFSLSTRAEDSQNIVFGDWQDKGNGVRVRVNHSSGLISLSDINLSPMQQLLAAHYGSDIDAQKFVDTLLDWQDGDSNARALGKEGNNLRQNNYHPRNAEIKTLKEVERFGILAPQDETFVEENFLLYSPLEFNERFASDTIKELLRLPELARREDDAGPIIVDIEIVKGEQKYQVRYGVDLWYAHWKNRIIFEYLR